MTPVLQALDELELLAGLLQQLLLEWPVGTGTLLMDEAPVRTGVLLLETTPLPVGSGTELVVLLEMGNGGTELEPWFPFQGPWLWGAVD